MPAPTTPEGRGREPAWRRYMRWWGPDVTADVDEEFAFHLEMRVSDYVRQGVDPAEARDRVLAEFGDIDGAKRECREIGERESRRRDWREAAGALRRDAQFAIRTLRRAPAFLGTTAATLALGIGATTAIFSVVYGVLLRPLPYHRPHDIVQLWQVGADGGTMQFSDPNFEDLRSRSRSFAAMAEFTPGSVVSVTGAAEPVRARSTRVSSDFLAVLAVQPVVGRGFASEDAHEGGDRTVLVSHGFWTRYLGGQRSAMGRVLGIDGRSYTVIGVLPRSADFPAGVELFVPRELEPPNPHRTGHNWQVLGRVREGTTIDQAQRELTSLARALSVEHGDRTAMRDVAVVPLREQMVGSVREPLVVLIAAAGMLLLIATANVVNLMLARLGARRGEIAVRLALGAGRLRLATQLLAESLVLAVVGGIGGVLLAVVAVRALVALQPEQLPRVGDIGIDLPILLFALGVSVATALILGLTGALRGTGGDLRDVLTEGQRSASGSLTSRHLRSSLVVAQVALAVVLLVGAGLLGRSLLALFDVDPGYRTERALVLDVNLSWPADVAEATRNVRFYDDLTSRLRGLPGVEKVGVVSSVPLGDGRRSNGNFLIVRTPDEVTDFAGFEALARDSSRVGWAQFRLAGPDYFAAMGIPLIQGRAFEERDVERAPHVAVISASLARARWPRGDALGKLIQFGNMDGDVRVFTIVGVVGDVLERSLAAEPAPTFYASYRQRTGGASTLDVVIRAERDIAPLVAPARAIVRELRPDVPPRFRTIEGVVGASVADLRYMALLIAIFGATALVMALLGIYSVISYLVAQRRREIGIRVALGASRRAVTGLVLRQGARLVMGGMLLGVGAALLLSRLLGAMLYGVSPTDPLAYMAVATLLAVVAILASWVPARRAARVPPAEVLRNS